MGRPRAIQGEVEKRLLEALENGMTVRLACDYAGIDPSTFTEEQRRNPTFAAHAREARVKHLPKALQDIRVDADWRAKQAWVQMNFPEEYGRQRLEVSGPGGGPIATVMAEVSPEFITDALRSLRTAEAESAPASPE